MKWIGQHIQSLISRFRSDVYLDSPTAGGSDPDKFLGIDSNGKIIYRTGTEVLSDIGAASSASDITGITITADDAGTATDTSGDLAITVSGGEGIDTSATGSTLTIASEDASTSNKGVVELATSAETNTGTDTGRAVTPDGLEDWEGSAQVTTLGTIGTGTWNADVIPSAKLDADTAHLSTQKQLTWHSFNDDMDTTKQYIGLLDADSENTATTNADLPFNAPVAGKLLKVFLSTNTNLTGRTLTWRLETQALGVTFGTGPTIVGTQSGAGPHNDSRTMIEYDFTSVDSNAIVAGDMVFLSVQSSGTTAQTKYYITCLWEWDLS